jgi:hypothetical protein
LEIAPAAPPCSQVSQAQFRGDVAQCVARGDDGGPVGAGRAVRDLDGPPDRWVEVERAQAIREVEQAEVGDESDAFSRGDEADARSTMSRQMPRCRTSRSRTPSSRKPQQAWSRRLATFSGKIPL